MLEGRGSPEYALTWKNWDMESGVPIFAVRASGHRTSGNDSTGWATPQARDYRSAEGNKPRWENPDRSRNLNDQVKALSGWPTPNAADSWTPDHTTENTMRRGDPNGTLRSTSGSLAKDAAMKVGWPTPQVVDSGKLGNRPNYGQVGLSNHPGLRGFPNRPPMKKSRSGDGQLTQPLGTEPSGSSASTTGKGGLTPEFVRWLMGFPDGWSSYAPTATRSSRKSGRSS